MHRISLVLPMLPACAGLMLVELAQAGELDKHLLPENTRFVAHVDFEALVRTKVFQAVEAEVMADLDHDEEVWSEMEKLGIDIKKDLKSATVFGENEDSGTVIFVTSDKLDAALNRAREEVHFETRSVGGLDLISIEGEDDGFLYVIAREGSGERVVFASDSSAAVVQAVRVFRGQERSLADSSHPAISASPAADSVLFISAGGLDSLSDLGAASQIAGMANSFVLDLGERSTKLFLRVSAQTASPKDALNLKAVVDGLRAMMTLAGGDEVPDFVIEMMNSVQLDVRGSEVLLTIELDVADLLEQIGDLGEF